ncbi:hypothetical protein [Flavobacterium macacae]|uniref:Uncharacterized protein n=1 Tax=Flavobacterium macacae TaxID=2488993 RepID=A0A3P3W7S9_9FLAO|nr:hypothetical protein [Flavobacterium macacae]RRJ90744.1 hypothetical protein EG849_09715 [Flavobacterium macacae]
MEKLEVQKKALSLGKLFVKQLKLKAGDDMLSMWMAHYIAEKMANAESAVGKQKAKLDKECFDTILALWKHRWTMQRGSRPLENFELLFEVLQKLDPDKEKSFYVDRFKDDDLKKLKKGAASREWLDIAIELDKIARLGIEYSLGKATEVSETDLSEEWLKNSSMLTDNADRKIIRILLERTPILELEDDESNIAFMENLKIEKIKNRIESLKHFSKINTKLLESLERDLITKE